MIRLLTLILEMMIWVEYGWNMGGMWVECGWNMGFAHNFEKKWTILIGKNEIWKKIGLIDCLSPSEEVGA